MDLGDEVLEFRGNFLYFIVALTVNNCKEADI
jgi:hypothetical protein